MPLYITIILRIWENGEPLITYLIQNCEIELIEFSLRGYITSMLDTPFNEELKKIDRLRDKYLSMYALKNFPAFLLKEYDQQIDMVQYINTGKDFENNTKFEKLRYIKKPRLLFVKIKASNSIKKTLRFIGALKKYTKK